MRNGTQSHDLAVELTGPRQGNEGGDGNADQQSEPKQAQEHYEPVHDGLRDSLSF
jgi:hypothetical protein